MADAMRDDFLDAIDSLESEEDTSAESTEATPEAAEEEAPVQSAPEESGEVSDSEDETVAATEAAENTPDVPAGAIEDDLAASAPATEDIKPPLGWTPKAREEWSKLPTSIKEQVSSREKEIAQTIHGTKEARRTHDHISNLAQSYAPVLAAEGAESPMQAIENLFQTASQLRMGSPTQKAERMAQLIQHYGVDIQQLDSVLAGTPEAQESSQFESMIDQKLAPINQVMQQLSHMQEQKQVTSQQQVAQQVDEFAKNAEFLGDVRNDMADLIDLASRQGREMGLEEAYNKACAMHPEISKVLEGRHTAERLATAGQSIQKKKQAASSVSGRQSGETSQHQDLSLHDEISSIWDSYS